MEKELNVVETVEEVETVETVEKKGFLTKALDVVKVPVNFAKKHKKITAVLGGLGLIGTGILIAKTQDSADDNYIDADVNYSDEASGTADASDSVDTTETE